MKTGAAADKRRLRIALLVDRFGNRFGGAEAYGVELMRILARRHDVTVVAREYDSDLALPFLPVRVSCRLPSWLRVLYFAWRAALTRAGFDIVHSHMNGERAMCRSCTSRPCATTGCAGRACAGA